jgi:hypothetical protein
VSLATVSADRGHTVGPEKLQSLAHGSPVATEGARLSCTRCVKMDNQLGHGLSALDAEKETTVRLRLFGFLL